MNLLDIKRVPPNALIGAYLTSPNKHRYRCVSYYVDIQNNEFVLEVQPEDDICSDPTETFGYQLSILSDWSLSLQGGSL